MALQATRSVGKLLPQTSALFVCDIQERFRPLITGYPTVVDTAKRTIRGVNALGVPCVVTEQYPKALGPTVPELLEVLPPPHTPESPIPSPGATHHKLFTKTLFSMVTPEVEQYMTKVLPHVKQVMLLGIEAHVCVLQTALDLISKGYEVHLLVDGISSQREADRAIAIQRLIQAGALMSSSEMALFQLAGDARNPHFKPISALAKEERAPHMVPLYSHL